MSELPAPFKLCTVCQQEKPADAFETTRFPDGTLYTRKKCRSCRAKEPRKEKRPEPPRILLIGDSHFPFASQECLAFIYRAIEAKKPTHVIQMGDLTDRFSASRFPRSHSVITPEEEFVQAREQSVAMWERIRAAAPKALCYQLIGNHDDRPLKRVLEKAPDLEPYVGRSYRESMTFEGVTTTEQMEIDGIRFQHGFTTHGKHAPRNRRSTVVGHLHKAGITYFADADGVYYEFNVGCVVDLNAKVFDYRIDKHQDRVTLGYGWIDEEGPRFIGFKSSVS